MFFHFFCPAAAGARPLPIRERWGAGAVPGRIDKGKPQKRGFPAFLAILFVSSHDVNVLNPIPYRIADAKVLQVYSIFQIFLTKKYAEKHIFLLALHQLSVLQFITI